MFCAPNLLLVVSATSIYILKVRAHTASYSSYCIQRSTFQAFLCTISSFEELEHFKCELLSNNKIRRATHNMVAYRFVDEQGILRKDFDDDGEDGAGKKLQELLRLMDVGNMVVLVSRWYGGIHLGSDRFKLICNCARNLIEEHLKIS